MNKISETVERLDIGVLINNMGIYHQYARFFHELDEELLKNLIMVNVIGTTKVTHVVLPWMLKRKKRTIINTGYGVNIVIPSDPFYVVYVTSKR